MSKRINNRKRSRSEFGVDDDVSIEPSIKHRRISSKMNSNENEPIYRKVPKNNKGSNSNNVPFWFTLQKKLGGGRFATVHEVDLFEDENKTIPVVGEFAGKICDGTQLGLASMVREIAIYEHLAKATDSQHVVKYYGAGAGINKRIILLQKFGISLFDYVHKKGVLPLLKMKKLTIYLLRAIQYIHGKKIILHDLKPQNILIRGDSLKDIELSICDFGSAMKKKRKGRKKRNEKDDDAKQHEKENDVYRTRRHACFDGKEKFDPDIPYTEEYKAPELWEDFAKEYDVECDLFAVGLIIRFMLVGKEPNWKGNKYKLSAEAVIQSTHLRPSLPQNIPSHLAKFISVFLAINPQHRITAKEALKLEEESGKKKGDEDMAKNQRSNRFLYTFYVDLSPLKQIKNLKQNLKDDVDCYCQLLLFLSRIFIKMNEEYEIMRHVLPAYCNQSGSETNRDKFRRSTLVQTLYAIEHNLTCILLTYPGQTVCTIHGDQCKHGPHAYSTIKKHWATKEVAKDLGGIQIPCLMTCGKLFGVYTYTVGKRKRRDIHDSCSKNKDIIPKCNGVLRKERLKQWIDFPQTQGKKMDKDQYDKECHCILELQKEWKCGEFKLETLEEEKISNDVVNYQIYHTQPTKVNRIACDEHPMELKKTTFDGRNKCDKCNETDFEKNSIAFSCSNCDDIIVCLECMEEYYL